MPGICAYQPNDSGGSSDDNSINRAPHFAWRNGNRPEVGESHHPVDQFSTTSNSSGEEREYQIETERRWQVVSSDSSSTSSIVQLQVERTDSSSTAESGEERESSHESLSTAGDALKARRAVLSRELDEDRPESEHSTLPTSLLASTNSENTNVPQSKHNKLIPMSRNFFPEFCYWLVCYPFEMLWGEWRYHSSPVIQQKRQNHENEGALINHSNGRETHDRVARQLRGKKWTAKDGTTLYYDFDERFFQLSWSTETEIEQTLNETPLEYLNMKEKWMVSAFQFCYMFLLINFACQVPLRVIHSILYYFSLPKYLTAYAINFLLYLYRFVWVRWLLHFVLNNLLLSSLDNKWEVLNDHLTSKEEMIYMPKATTESFQRVKQHLHVKLLSSIPNTKLVRILENVQFFAVLYFVFSHWFGFLCF